MNVRLLAGFAIVLAGCGGPPERCRAAPRADIAGWRTLQDGAPRAEPFGEEQALSLARRHARAEIARALAELARERPGLAFTIDDYEQRVSDDRADGCAVVTLSLYYRNPPGRELGVGHPGHFSVRVYRETGRVDLLPGH